VERPDRSEWSCDVDVAGPVNWPDDATADATPAGKKPTPPARDADAIMQVKV